MRMLSNGLSMLAMVLLFGVSLGWAQAQQGQPQQQAPSGQQPTNQGEASSPSPPSQAQTGLQQPLQQPSTEQNQTESAPSNAPPLTGAERYTLSQMGAGRSYVVPSFQFAQSVETNGTGAFGASTVTPISTVSGVLALHHLWSRYDLTVRYAGSGFLYDRQPDLNTSAHEFSFTQQITGRRSFFRLSDAATYLPQSSFGYASFSGVQGVGGAVYGYGGLFGASGGNLNTTFLPGQSIITGPSSQVANSVVGEYDYRTSPLSTLTLTGSYNLLWFPNSGFINSNAGIFQIGYNHQLTRKNSLGLSYQAGIFRFEAPSTDFTNHMVSFTYRRTISERLGLQLGAGPQINLFNESGPQQDTSVSWQASGLLTYAFQRSSVGINYTHYTNGGSGVYSGARTDAVGVSFGIPLSRMWSTNANLGYAYNTTVQGANLPGVGASYNSWYGTINLQRTLNRSLSMFFGYNLQQQRAKAPTCIGATCGTFYTRQYFSFGLNWHPILSDVVQ